MTISKNTITITARATCETNAGKPGDVFRFYKIVGGWTALNTRTGKYYHAGASTIRAAFEIVEQIAG